MTSLKKKYKEVLDKFTNEFLDNNFNVLSIFVDGSYNEDKLYSESDIDLIIFINDIKDKELSEKYKIEFEGIYFDINIYEYEQFKYLVLNGDSEVARIANSECIYQDRGYGDKLKTISENIIEAKQYRLHEEDEQKLKELTLEHKIRYIKHFYNEFNKDESFQKNYLNYLMDTTLLNLVDYYLYKEKYFQSQFSIKKILEVARKYDDDLYEYINNFFKCDNIDKRYDNFKKLIEFILDNKKLTKTYKEKEFSEKYFNRENK